MKFNQVKATDVNKAKALGNVILLPVTKHIQRQLMIIDSQDNPLYNCEFPMYPAKGGLFAGNPSWKKAFHDIIKQCQESSNDIAEVYFSGAPVEYEQIKKELDKMNQTEFKAKPVACFYVKPDLEELIADARLNSCAAILGVTDEDEFLDTYNKEADADPRSYEQALQEDTPLDELNIQIRQEVESNEPEPTAVVEPPPPPPPPSLAESTPVETAPEAPPESDIDDIDPLQALDDLSKGLDED